MIRFAFLVGRQVAAAVRWCIVDPIRDWRYHRALKRHMGDCDRCSFATEYSMGSVAMCATGAGLVLKYRGVRS